MKKADEIHAGLLHQAAAIETSDKNFNEERLARVARPFKSGMTGKIEDWKKTKPVYELGGKCKKRTDCSGFTARILSETALQVNMAAGTSVYDPVLFAYEKLVAFSAAEQIQGFGAKTGFIDTKRLHAGDVLPGTLIGVSFPKESVPKWAKGRFKNISHVVVVVEKDGSLYAAHSSSEHNGIAVELFEAWLQAQNRMGNSLHAVDPFALMEKNNSRLARIARTVLNLNILKKDGLSLLVPPRPIETKLLKYDLKHG